MEGKKLFGEIMISHGFISVEQVIQARYKQLTESSKKIGECLLELGYINQQQLTDTIKIQAHMRT